MTTTLNVQIDSKDKKDFEAFCDSVGLTPSLAISLFIKATLRGGIPFEIKADPFFSETNQERLSRNAELVSEGKVNYHEVNFDI